MASIDITHIGEFIIKNGAKAVMLVWLASQQWQINQITADYKDCMNDRVNDAHRSNSNSNRSVAVLPEQIKVKRWDEEQKS